MDGKKSLRILSALVLVAAVAGIAYLAFAAGTIQGAATRLPAAASQPGYAPYPYFGGPLFLHPFPFFGLGCFGPLLGLFLLFIALRAITHLLWVPRWGGWSHREHGRRHGWYAEGGVPPMFRTWHDNLHGSTEPEKKE